jgi:hypothetical protein
MHAAQNTTSRLLGWIPYLFGFVGLLLCAVYQSQRSGLLFHSLDRFIQHHLDAVAGIASLAALLGIVSGLVIVRNRGRSRLVTFGTIFAAAVLFWSIFGLSL